MARSGAPDPTKREAAGEYRQKLAVSFEYPVYFTEAVFAPRNPVFARALCPAEPPYPTRFLVAVDRGVAEAWPALAENLAEYVAAHPHLEPVAPLLVLPGGEEAKRGRAVVDRLHRALRELHLDRHSIVVAIGGGALLDAVGYAAATAHRGIRLVRLPTTVLAQNDAGIGVKNGLNAFGAKNFVGTFAPPFAVINDVRFIGSLPLRERRAGVAEAVKVALIRDAAFFGWIEAYADRLRAGEPAALAPLIRRAAELHLDHIRTSGDPFESGSARPLDFGHWAAHRIESLSEHRVRHGEAVAIGMALDLWYSHDLGWLSAAALERACGALEAVGLRLWDDVLERSDDAGAASLLAGLEEFREHLGGRLTVTLLAEIGRGVEVHALEAPRIERGIEWLRQRDRAR